MTPIPLGGPAPAGDPAPPNPWSFTPDEAGRVAALPSAHVVFDFKGVQVCKRCYRCRPAGACDGSPKG